MKDSKKMFILMEVTLAVMVIILAVIMFLEKSGEHLNKISVIVQNSEDSQWAAFKYGLRMAAQDQNVEVIIVSTDGRLTLEEEKEMIEHEIDNGADAVIVQPIPGVDSEEMLKKIEKKVPVMLVDCLVVQDGQPDSIPVTKPDNYRMGMELAEELLKDYSGKIEGKTMGFFAESGESAAAAERKDGFCTVLQEKGAQVCWSVSDLPSEDKEKILETQEKVDFVIAFDDDSLTTAGKAAAANNLHGALVYGIGNSTEAIYYLDTDFVQCLLVPDMFNVGYQSLTQTAQNLEQLWKKAQSQTISFTVIRRDALFSKENQEILFTMSQ